MASMRWLLHEFVVEGRCREDLGVGDAMMLSTLGGHVHSSLLPHEGWLRHAYWALVESYRTERGPRPRVVAYLGQLDKQGHLGVQQAVTQPAAGKRRHLLRVKVLVNSFAG